MAIYNFTQLDGVVYGVASPVKSKDGGMLHKDSEALKNNVVEWLEFLKSSGISYVVNLIDEAFLSKVKANTGVDILAEEKSFFGDQNVLWAPFDNYTYIDKATAGTILEFLKGVKQNGGKVAVHCLGGVGRTAQVLALWLNYDKGLDYDSSVETVNSLEGKHNVFEATEKNPETQDSSIFKGLFNMKNDITNKVEAELRRRELLSDTEDTVVKYANVFRKTLEPHNGILNDTKSIGESFKNFITQIGSSIDSNFAVKLASKFEDMYPEFAQGGLKQIVTNAKSHGTEVDADGLAQEGITAVDAGDYPNESTGGKAENQSNEERAEKGFKSMKKEKVTPRNQGPTRTADTIKKLRNFERGYGMLTTAVNTNLTKAAMVLSKDGLKTKAHRQLKRSVAALDELLPDLAERHKVISAHLRAITSTKVAADDEKKEKEEISSIKDVSEAVDMLLETVDEAKKVEETLRNIQEMADEALPEGGEDEDVTDDLFGEGDMPDADELPDDESLADEAEDEGEPVEEEKLEQEEYLPDGEVKDEKLDTDEVVQPEPKGDKDKKDNFDDLNMLVKGVNKLKSTFEAISGLFVDKKATAPYFDKDQRAFNDTVKDMPNEDTFNDATLKSQEERANKGRKDIDKENKNPAYIHEPGHIQDLVVKAHLALGETYSDSAIVVTANGEPKMVATYADVAGNQVNNPDNFKRFISKAYLEEVENETKKRGLASVKNEMCGSYVTTAAQRKALVKRVKATRKTDISAIAATLATKKQAADKKLDEKAYYAEAYGDQQFANDLTKKQNAKASEAPEVANLKKENAELKRKEVLRVKASRAIETAKTISSLVDSPFSHSEFTVLAKEIMSLDDAGFKVVSSIINKIAERTEPSDNGITGNSLEGVESGKGGSYARVEGKDGLDGGVVSDASSPQSNITAPKESSMRRPVSSGAIPQMTRTASGATLDKLSSMFTCTKNTMRRKGYTDQEIEQLEFQARIR